LARESDDTSRRWTFIALLAAATFINYLDRGSLAVALPIISRDLELTPVQQGLALSAFFWTYAAMQIPMGWIVDRYDTKRVYAVAFALWSLSAAATGLVRGLGELLLCRILLGLGESVYLPGGMKVVSRHFPAHEAAWPAGLFDLGAKLGLAAGTAIDVWLLVRFGWRSLFFRTGLAGLLWLWPWLSIYPSGNPGTRRPARSPSARPPSVAWSSLFTNQALIGMSLGFFCWDYFWYFIISWLPSYLYVARHVRLADVALFGSLPFVTFAVAEAAGAWGAGALVRRSHDLSAVTKGFIAAGFVLGLLVIPAALVESRAASIGFLLAASLSGIACGNMLAVPKICAPDDQVALWTGVQNFVGNIGGVLAPVVTGYLIARTGSYVPAFFVVAGILVVGVASYVFVVPPLPAPQRVVTT
jgi:ACS family D-galactonate transporter-like MFS transporter